MKRGWAAAVLYNTSPAVLAFTHVTRGGHLTPAQPSSYPEYVELAKGKRKRLTDNYSVRLALSGQPGFLCVALTSRGILLFKEGG